MFLQIIGEKTFRISRIAFLEMQSCVSPGLIQGVESKRKCWVWMKLMAYLACASLELTLLWGVEHRRIVSRAVLAKPGSDVRSSGGCKLGKGR